MKVVGANCACQTSLWAASVLMAPLLHVIFIEYRACVCRHCDINSGSSLADTGRLMMAVATVENTSGCEQGVGYPKLFSLKPLLLEAQM